MDLAPAVPDIPQPPTDVVGLAGSVDGWVPVEATSPGPSQVWLTETHAVKSVPATQAADLDAAEANATWLGEHVSTAPALLRADSADHAWLVSDRLVGVPSHRPDLHGDVGSLAEVAGNALRELHALSIDLAPSTIESGWDALDAVVAANVAAGLGEVDEPYQRYSGEKLLELWRQGRPAAEELVICHGNATLPNMIAQQGMFAGWVDLGGVRLADRHLDLAMAHESIHRSLGPEAVYVFYDTYGQDPELLRLDHYLLAKQLFS